MIEHDDPTQYENVLGSVDITGLSGFVETTAIAGLVVTLIFAGWTLAKNSLKKSTN